MANRTYETRTHVCSEVTKARVTLGRLLAANLVVAASAANQLCGDRKNRPWPAGECSSVADKVRRVQLLVAGSGDLLIT